MKTQVLTLSLLAALAASLCITNPAAATVTWTGAGTNSVPPTTNWSASVNWAGGTPGSANTILFTNAGVSATVSNTDNIVDGNNTILGLIYGNTTGYHTTFINPGQTLTVTNPAAANILWVGTATDNGGSEIVNTTIIGPTGALVVSDTNVTSQMVVQQGSGTTGTHNATLNMAALGSFNLTGGRLLVGAAVGSSLNASNYASGTLMLARTNVIQLIGATTPTFDVGDAVNNGSTQLVQLGQTNAIYAGTLTVAHTKATATMQFNPSLAGSNPTLYLRSSNTVGRVAVVAVGDMSGTSGSSSSANGNLNLSLGTVDAQVNACYVAKGQSATGSGLVTGVLTLGAGVFNVNTLNAGYLIAANTTGPANGTINVNASGTLVVNTNLALGVNPGASSTATGTLNITNGTVDANSITNVGGNYNSTINVAGGTLVVSNTAGTAAAPITTLAVSNAILTLNAVISGATVSVGMLNIYGTADTLNLGAVPPTTSFPAQYPVISYAGGSLNGTYDFSLGSLPAPYLGYLSNNTANSSVDVVITNVNVKLDVWNGNVNGNWDASTLNWLYKGSATIYHAGDFVQFDDTLSGTANVLLTTTLSPGTLVVTNSTHNYGFSGSGLLSGALGVTKSGSGTLTLAETGGDNFSGGIAVNNGTVILDQPGSAISGGLTIASGATAQIGNNDNNGALPAGTLADYGTLAFSRSGNVTLATAIGGTGGLTQNGSGTLTLSANNGYSGLTTVLKGTLAVGVAGAVANSAQVAVSNGTLDLSAVTGTTSLSTVNNLALTNATLNIGLPYAQPAVSVASLAAGGTANTITVSALPPFSSYPTPVVLIQSATPISGNNFVLGSLPAASPAYNGTLSLSADQTTLYLNVSSGPAGVRPYVVWTGGDASLDTNWSDALNWLEAGAPGGADNVIFCDVDAQYNSALNSPGSGTLNGDSVNNYVNQNFTVATLTYTNVNNDYQNTLIAGGATLTVTNGSTNAASIVAIGSSSTSFGTSGVENVTIAGANGTFTVANTNASFYVGLGAGGSGSQQATLDLSALGTFNATVNTFDVGAMPSSSLDVSGIAYLAQTNLIIANGGAVNEGSNGTVTLSLLVGETTSTAGALPSVLYLGQNNVLNVNSVGVGVSKNSGQILFNPALSGQNPTAVFRFSDGVSPVTAWSIGDGLGQTGASTSPTGTVDLTGGSVDALVTSIYIGRSPNVSGGHPSTGTLSFGAGIINAVNLYDGYQAYNNTDFGVGTVNVNGPGTLAVSGALYLAQTSGGTGAASTTGTLNITGGTVAVGSIVTGAGGATSTITVQDATLSVTNFAGSATAPVANFTAGDSVLQLGLAAGIPNLEVGTLSVNNTSNNTINILSLPPIYSYPAHIPLIGYASYSPAGPTDFVLGSLPAGSSAYSGFSIANNPTDNTIDLVITSGPVSVSPQVIWSGANAATDINWTDALNWLQPGNQGAPLSSQAVLFYDLGGAAAPGTVDNIVTASTTVASLQYGNTNNYHTTLINPGVTLTISNNLANNLIFVGTGTDNGTNQNVTATITGSKATLNVVSTNIASEVQVQQGSVAAGNHLATLNLAGLDNFNLAAGRLLVAGNPGLAVNASNYLGGTLILAKTNVIQLSATNAPALNIADALSNGNTTTNALELGQANSLFADTITVGRSKSNGSLQFNPALGGSNPALYLRGQTAPAVSQLAIGDDSTIGVTGLNSAGTADFSLGTVNALVNTCYVGRGQNGNGAGTATGLLILGAGVFNVNTLNVGAVTVNSAIASSTGTVDVTAGGTLVINTSLALGLNPGATAAAIATLNITNGVVLANAITPGTGNGSSTINLAGGTLVVSNTVGSPSTPLGTMNLGGGSLQLNVNGAVAQTNLVATTVTVSSPTLVGLSTVSGVATGTAYPLISYTGADPYANFSLGPVPAGYAATLVDNAAAKLISVQFTTVPGQLPPTINQVSTVNGSLVFSGSNGVANGTFYVLTATNLALPPANWTRVSTNMYSAVGTFSVTNAINPAVGREFYRIAQ